MTAQQLFDKQWTLALLDRVLDQLQAEYEQSGKAAQFAALSQFITAQTGKSVYGAASEELGMSSGAVKAAVHRMRTRYRELLRSEIAQTVINQEEVDDEIRCLFQSLEN